MDCYLTISCNCENYKFHTNNTFEMPCSMTLIKNAKNLEEFHCTKCNKSIPKDIWSEILDCCNTLNNLNDKLHASDNDYVEISLEHMDNFDGVEVQFNCSCGKCYGKPIMQDAITGTYNQPNSKCTVCGKNISESTILNIRNCAIKLIDINKALRNINYPYNYKISIKNGICGHGIVGAVGHEHNSSGCLAFMINY